MTPIAESELILNPDGRLFDHLHLKPEENLLKQLLL